MLPEIEEEMKLCDWLIERGLTLEECSEFLIDQGCGDTFSIALYKVYNRQRIKNSDIDKRLSDQEWGCPLTP